MIQKFHAAVPFEFANGATGWHPYGGPFDCLGPFAKVQNCPIGNTQYRLTCYATDYADTYFSVPAVTRIHGQRVTGFFSLDNEDIHFYPDRGETRDLEEEPAP